MNSGDVVFDPLGSMLTVPYRPRKDGEGPRPSSTRNIFLAGCTVTCLLKPAAAQAERQAARKTFGTSGRASSPVRPSEPPICA